MPVFWRTGFTRSFSELPVDDAPFVSVEVQRITHQGVDGIVVATHRPTGAIEMYAQPKLQLDEQAFRGDPAFGQFELALLAPTDFEIARCDVEPGEVDTEIAFTDGHGRGIEVRARYQTRRRSPSLVTPAPLQANPMTLRFLLMHEFRLIPRRGSELRVAVDGREAAVKPFLVPSDRSPVTQARLSTDLLLVGLLPAHRDRALLDGADPVEQDGNTVPDFADGRLVGVATSNEHGAFAVRFPDALPNPAETPTGASRTGRFVVDSSLGTVASGQWGLRRVDDETVTFELTDVRQDWSPPRQQVTRLALQRIRRFRRRRLRWSYAATLRQDSAGWASSGSWSISSS